MLKWPAAFVTSRKYQSHHASCRRLGRPHASQTIPLPYQTSGTKKGRRACGTPYVSKCAPPGPEGRGLGPAGEIGVWARVGRAQPRDEQSTPPTAPARLERPSRVAESDREDLYSDAVDRTWRRCWPSATVARRTHDRARGVTIPLARICSGSREAQRGRCLPQSGCSLSHRRG